MSLIICPNCKGNVIFCVTCDAYYCTFCKKFFDDVNNTLKERYDDKD